MKTSNVFVAISESMVRATAKAALKGGVSIKKVREYLSENGLLLVSWENSNLRTYMAVEPIRDLIGVEFEPEKVDRNQFEKVLSIGGVIEI